MEFRVLSDTKLEKAWYLIVVNIFDESEVLDAKTFVFLINYADPKSKLSITSIYEIPSFDLIDGFDGYEDTSCSFIQRSTGYDLEDKRCVSPNMMLYLENKLAEYFEIKYPKQTSNLGQLLQDCLVEDLDCDK